MIRDYKMDELAGRDIDRIARRMRLMFDDVESVERQRELNGVPIVEPSRSRKGEDRGEHQEEQSDSKGVLARNREAGAWGRWWGQARRWTSQNEVRRLAL